MARLFSAEFLGGEDANAPLIALTRSVGVHSILTGWLPAWYGGVPFDRLGPIGLPWAASIVARLFSWTPQHAFHFVGAFACCALPCALYLGLRRVQAGWNFAFVSALLYCVAVPSQYSLLKNGGAPHLLGTLLAISFVTVAYEAARRNTVWAFIGSPLILAALLLTDLLSAVAVLVVLVAYCLSQPGKVLRKELIALLGIGFPGTLLVSPLVNVDSLLLWKRNVLATDGALLGHASFYGLTVLVVFILSMHYLFARTDVPAVLRFLTYASLILGAMLLGQRYSAFRLVPHSEVLVLDLGVVACPLLTYLAILLWRRAERRARAVAAVALFGLAAIQVTSLYRKNQVLFQHIDVTQSSSYRVSAWLGQHDGGRRVFAPGQAGTWLNVFGDTAQVTGCCADWVPNQLYPTASWAILTGQNAGTNDVPNAVTWLRTLGAGLVVVDNSFSKPQKFEGVLPRVFQDGDLSVYSLPAPSDSLAHVIAPKDAIRYIPESGLDLLPVQDYVRAIGSDTQTKCKFRWIDNEHARIDAEVLGWREVSVQMNYDGGWSAVANGKRLPMRADAAGMILIDPQCSGPCTIDLTWSPPGWPWKYTACLLATFVLLSAFVWRGHGTRKHWFVALAGILLMVLLIRSAWVAEDAYISLRVTDNLLAGYGATWNIDERVQTYTDPLFTAAVTVATWALKDVYTASVIVSLLFTVGALWLLFRGATNQGLALGMLALFFSKGFVDFSVSGLENPATHLAIAAYLFVYFRRRDPLLLSLCAAAAALNREDSVLLFVPSLALVYWTAGWRVCKRALIGWSPFLLWLVFATFYYGFPFPNTAYAKLRTGIPIADVIHQGIAYYWNAWHWDTGTIVVLVAGSIAACVVGQWTIAAGIALNALYVVSVGGDYMTSRFLTAGFIVAVATIAHYWKMRRDVGIAVGALIVSAGITIPAPAITSASATFGQPWPVEPGTRVADERAYAYPCAGLLRRGIQQPPWPGHWIRTNYPYWYSCQGPPVTESAERIWPDAYLSRIGNVWQVTNVRTFVIGNVGMAGYFAGPKVHLIDDMGLGDALLARLPMIPAPDWVAGHYRRTVPDGYIDTIASGRNQIHDASLHEYYDHLHSVISGKLSDTQRLKEIYLFNAGHYDYLIDQYVRRSKKR